MKPVALAVASLAVIAFAGSAVAADTGNFVVKLGQDTVSVEHYERSDAKLEIHQMGRAPRVLQRVYTFDFAHGLVTHASLVVTAPGGASPLQTLDCVAGADSVRSKIVAGPATQSLSVPAAPGMLILAGQSPWAAYESQCMKLVAGKRDSVTAPLYFLGTNVVYHLAVRKLGRDSAVIWNDHQDVYHAALDKTGHIVGVTPISGTQKMSVQRVAALDVNAIAAAYAAREQAAGAMGLLSPRDTVRANVAGATLLVDYGRPGKRGRAIYGNIVPYDQVWRTGANAATQFRTDKALDFGNGVVVPAGFYTLWTLPSAAGWKLIVNSQTGQWGTDHNPDKDLYTIPMKVSALPDVVERFTITIVPAPEGGVFNLDWDTTRASAAFSVKP